MVDFDLFSAFFLAYGLNIVLTFTLKNSYKIEIRTFNFLYA